MLTDHIETAVADNLDSSEEEVFVFPTSFAQQRLWFLDKLLPNSLAYNIPTVLRLEGQLNIPALEQSLNEIVRRHETLRTTFGEVEGQPVQLITPAVSLKLPVIDLDSLPLPQREAEVRRLVTAETKRPFNLAHSFSFRTALFRLARQEYVILVAMHHIISDGWSMKVLIQEMTQLYQAYATGNPSPLPELSIQYADFAVWQREWLQGEVLETQLDYWRQRLAGIQPRLSLPTDRPRPAVLLDHGAIQTFTLPPTLTQKLKRLSHEERSTLFMTLLAAFQLLLCRYSGQDDIAVGSPISGRNQAATLSSIGFFVNTLVLRTDLSGKPTFRELLRRVRQVVLEAFDHQDVPFERLVEELQPERNLSQSPFFQVMFTLQNPSQETLTLSGLKIKPVPIELGAAQFDLSLSIVEVDQRLDGLLEYNTDLFNDDTIARLLTHFQSLLESITADPDQTIFTLNLLTPGERQKLVEEWNRTRIDFSSPPCIHQLFEERVEQMPDAIAVVFAEEQLTYRQLNNRANHLAHRLRALGVEPETLVGLYVERSLEMIIGVMAILKANGAYLPLDPTYPTDRLASMLADAHVPVLLTQEHLASTLPEHNASLIYVDVAGESGPAPNPINQAACHNLAYMLYTSGSTGKPKGVMINHQSLVNAYLAWEEAYVLGGGGHCHLQMASFSFDVFSGDLVRALCSGGKLLLCPRELLLMPANLYALMRRHGVTDAEFVPAVLRLLVRHLKEIDHSFNFMRLLIVGSDIWHVREHAEAQNLCDPDTRFVNSYGLTEATIDSSYFEGKVTHLAADGTVPIGRPLANTEVYILDRYLQPVPIGVAGELCLGGPGVARGYYHDPQQTAVKFIPHPFSRQPGEKLYKSGDLARYRADGTIELLGRVDQQIKLRGMRLEVGEIEGILGQHTAVQDAVVLAYDIDTGFSTDKRLVAYVVPNLQAPDLGGENLEKSLTTEQVKEWKIVFEDLYEVTPADAKPMFNLAGWDSSYTGLPFPEAEIHEWIKQTTDRILSLKPKRVLEIGCGSGLILSQVAPLATTYYAIDQAQAPLDYIQQELSAAAQDWSQITLLRRRAHEIDFVAPKTLDTVILASVVQYFPDIHYLLYVLDQAVKVVKPGGAVFVGDVRSLPLLEAFHASVELSKAPDSLSIPTLQQQIREKVATEKQLVVNPAFFTALKQHLPEISHVEVLPKRGQFHNEFSMFRYDVILHIGEGTPSAQDISWLDWRNEKPSLDTVRQLLETEAPAQLGISHIANARILTECCLLAQLEKCTGLETAADLHQTLTQQCTDPGIDPEELWLISKTLSYNLKISWAGAHSDGSYDVVFRHQSAEITSAVIPFPQPTTIATEWDEYASKPVQQRLTELLVPQLRKHLKERLPGHMIPAKFMLLADLPLTPNGKVDRLALPVPPSTRPDLEKAYVAPRTAIEETLAEIWANVLGLERVGIHDNFFDSGGHSLLATQIISRLKLAFQAEFPLRFVFEFPTIAELAQLVVAQQLEQVKSDDLDDILAAIDELSDEEAALLLSTDREQSNKS